MEERYEFIEKIGQGGIGSVHRVYDRKMGRHVAIKRILTSGEDPTLEAEATKQMMAEVGALSALQHPHIVTVFDVGEDEEGPFVVMELLKGKTLDEIIENAPLTWEDFRLVVMQSLEALIAAHDLEMIHSDLKPPNIMLTWMPSGAFQVKIVDFGLATLIHKQSKEELEKMDSVYGSVFFMPPEQFERKTLDARSDLYSLGCCFYQSLAGDYPFNGETGAKVMHAHLDHTVTPIGEIREDIPAWVCDWVMWMINRFPDDRPPSAREALSVFLQNDKAAAAAAAVSQAPEPEPKKSRLITSNVAPQTGLVATASQTSAVAASATTDSNPTETTADPPAGVDPDSTVPARPIISKNALKIAIPAAAAIMLVLSVWMIMKRNENVRQRNAYIGIVSMGESRNVSQIQLSDSQLGIVFDFIEKMKTDTELGPAITTLNKATGDAQTNVDEMIVHFITTSDLQRDVRIRLIEEVLPNRNSEVVVPKLIHYAATAGHSGEAIAAFEAIRPSMREPRADALLEIIASTSHAELRQMAESRMEEIIARSNSRDDLAALINQAAKNASTSEARESLDRLLSQCQTQSTNQKQAQSTGPGTSRSPAPTPPATPDADTSRPATDGSQEVKRLLEAYATSDHAGKIEIITALGRAEHQSVNQSLLRIIDDTDDEAIHTAAIKALIEYNQKEASGRHENSLRRSWVRIVWRCKTLEQGTLVIDALAGFREEWATRLLREMGRNRNPEIANYARKIYGELNQSSDD